MAKAKAGRVSMHDLMKLVNKKAGREVAHDLTTDNPTSVKEWIPTGSRWLDSIICKGKRAGIPIGKVVEIAGLEATGKSYMAAQIAANAQKQGKLVVYFDSESAIDPTFLEEAGCDLSRLMYVQASSVEFVLETIEELLGATDEKLVLIWDSLAFTPAVSDVEGDFNPQSSMAMKARILAKGMSKLTIPIADKQATFIVLNQLKTNIPQGPTARIVAMTTPYITPGGKAMHYVYSLRIWLTGRKAKSAFIEDDVEFVRVTGNLRREFIVIEFHHVSDKCTEVQLVPLPCCVTLRGGESIWVGIPTTMAVCYVNFAALCLSGKVSGIKVPEMVCEYRMVGYEYNAARDRDLPIITVRFCIIGIDVWIINSDDEIRLSSLWVRNVVDVKS